MRKIKKNWRFIEVKKGDLLVIYRGTGDSPDNCIAIKGNIKRDERVEKIFDLIVDQY